MWLLATARMPSFYLGRPAVTCFTTVQGLQHRRSSHRRVPGKLEDHKVRRLQGDSRQDFQGGPCSPTCCHIRSNYSCGRSGDDHTSLRPVNEDMHMKASKPKANERRVLKQPHTGEIPARLQVVSTGGAGSAEALNCRGRWVHTAPSDVVFGACAAGLQDVPQHNSDGRQLECRLHRMQSGAPLQLVTATI